MGNFAADLIKTSGQKLNLQTVFFAGVVGLTLYLVLVPLLFLIWSSFHMAASPFQAAPLGLNNYRVAYLDPATYSMLLNTFWFALGSVLIGLILGVGFAWLLERTNIPLKNLLYAMVPLPMIIPGMLSAIAWILILSPRIGIINMFFKHFFGIEKAMFNIYSMGGMYFVQGIRMVPTMFLMMVGAFRSMDPSLEEASAISGCGILNTLRRITGPLMLPAILSAAIYSFTSAMEAFEVPGVIGLTAGIHVFSTQIYLTARNVPVNYSLASAFAVTFVVISIILMIAYSRMTRQAERFATITGKGYRPRVIDLGRWRYVGAALILVFTFIALILPAFVLIWGSLQPYYQVPSLEGFSNISLAAYRSAFGYSQITLAFKNTLLVMVGASTFAVVLGTLIAWIVVRTKMKGRYVFDTLTFLPHGIPSIVIGLALLIVYIKLKKYIPIYGTLWILMIAFCTRYMTFGVRTMNAAMHQIHKELEEAAWISGASWRTMFTRITVPLLMPSVLSVWIWTAMHAIRELSAAIMLSTPKTMVVSMVIWDLWREGYVSETCVMGVILIATMAVILLMGRIYGLRVGKTGGL
jgi:iron(III) transport system permease protein